MLGKSYLRCRKSRQHRRQYIHFNLLNRSTDFWCQYYMEYQKYQLFQLDNNDLMDRLYQTLNPWARVQSNQRSRYIQHNKSFQHLSYNICPLGTQWLPSLLMWWVRMSDILVHRCNEWVWMIPVGSRKDQGKQLESQYLPMGSNIQQYNHHILSVHH